MGVSDLFLGRDDAHLCDIVGVCWYFVWQAPIFSSFFSQNVVQVWNPT